MGLVAVQLMCQPTADRGQGHSQWGQSDDRGNRTERIYSSFARDYDSGYEKTGQAGTGQR